MVNVHGSARINLNAFEPNNDVMAGPTVMMALMNTTVHLPVAKSLAWQALLLQSLHRKSMEDQFTTGFNDVFQFCFRKNRAHVLFYNA